MNISLKPPLKSQGNLNRMPNESGMVTEERLAAQRAGEKANSLKWDQNTAVIAYGVLAAVIILSFRGIATEIVALVAAFGLAIVWFTGWRRGKQLFRRLYGQELHQIRQTPQGEEIFMPPPLTPRETEILSHIACGCTNKQIAYKFGISEQTIKNHMTSILRKLDANDRTQAVVLALQYGWFSSRVKELTEPTNKQ